MTEGKSIKRSESVGTTVKAGSVTRPDGTEQTVTDGLYVLDVPGTFLVDGQEVTAK